MKKKIICLLLATLLVVSSLVVLAACVVDDGGLSAEERAKTTVIKINSFKGGIGDKWLINATERFKQLKKNESYEDGKTGVYFDIEGSTTDYSVDSMSSTATHIFITENRTSPYLLSQKGDLVSLTDIVKAKDATGKSIEDRLDPVYRESLKGADGEYYALPNYEYYPGVVYNVDCFVTNNLYIAAPEEQNVIAYNCDFGSCNFVRNANGKKSCGNDGVYGTDDDGLPTSIKEFLILCEYMSKKKGITPLTWAGFHWDYTAYMLQGMLTSMLGYDGMMNFYDFAGENVTVVTGFSDTEKLVEGFDIPAPITQQVSVTEATGYLSRDVVERYYVTALLEIIERKGWNTRTSLNTSSTHFDAQYNFVFGGQSAQYPEEIAMLCEGSYWYNEAKTAGTFEDFAFYCQGIDRHLGWMSLPTSWDKSVTEGNGREVALLDDAFGYCYVNKKYENNQGIMRAVKEFLQFLYSDEEIKAFTAETGVAKAGFNPDYITDDVLSGLSEFQKSVLNLKRHNKVAYAVATNKTFIENVSMFRFCNESPVFKPIFNGTSYSCYFQAMHTGNFYTKDIFVATQLTATQWNNYYKGVN